MFRIGKLLALGAALSLCAFQEVATIESISPTAGPEGMRVTVIGNHLDRASSVAFGKTASTFKVISSTELIAIVPRWAKSATIVASTPEGPISAPNEFVVQNDPRIPDDVGWKAGYVNPVRAPADFKAALPWGIAIADTRDPDFSKATVEIRRLKLSCTTSDQESVLNDDSGAIRGGLYRRSPWFGTDEHTSMPMEFGSSGTVVLRVGTRPDRVWHFWSASRRAALPSGQLKGCKVKAWAKISKGTLMQIGMDYWRTTDALWNGPDVNNHEAGASNWYFPSDRWQEITFTDVGGVQF